MTVSQLMEKLELTGILVSEPEREVTGCYMGDLLSWVMGRAQPNEAWITIMTNQNVAAVAALSDVACVILTEGVKPDPELLKKAQIQGINLLGTERSSFQIAVELGKAL